MPKDELCSGITPGCGLYAALPAGRERQLTGSPVVGLHFHKHPADQVCMEVQMPVQAGAEPAFRLWAITRRKLLGNIFSTDLSHYMK